MPDQAAADQPFKFKTLRPQKKPVELDDGRALELRSPDDDSVSEWNSSLPETKDGERFNLMMPETRQVVRTLIGRCLFNGDAQPVGAQFVKDTFHTADINEMFLWLIDAAGMRATEDEIKN